MPFRIALVGESAYMKGRLAGLLQSAGFEIDLRASEESASLFDRRLHTCDVIIVSTDLTDRVGEKTLFDAMLDTRAILFLDEEGAVQGKDQPLRIRPEMSPEKIISTINHFIFLNSRERKSLRVKVSLPVEYRCEGRTARSTILELGENGLFIQTLAPPAVTTPVSLRFALPGLTGDIAATGHVAYGIGCDLDRNIISHPAQPEKKIIALPGMGIMIDEMTEEDRRTIRRYIQEQC